MDGQRGSGKSGTRGRPGAQPARATADVGALQHQRYANAHHRDMGVQNRLSAVHPVEALHAAKAPLRIGLFVAESVSGIAHGNLGVQCDRRHVITPSGVMPIGLAYFTRLSRSLAATAESDCG